MTDWELIVVDDASTDQTAEELAELGRRVDSLDVIRHPVNKGLAGALRTGMAAAEPVTSHRKAEARGESELRDRVSAARSTPMLG